MEYDEEFLYDTNVNDIIQLYLDKEEEQVLFTGVLSDIQLKYEQGVCYAEIFGESSTSLMDNEEKSHSFQNKKMKYKELTEEINKSYSNSDTICTLEKDKTIGKMIIISTKLYQLFTHQGGFSLCRGK